MYNRIRRTTAALCLVLLVAGTMIPMSASAGRSNSILNKSDSEANNITTPVMTDIILLRPLGLVTMVISVVLFVVPVAPITLLTRPSEIGKPIETMIFAPARFVWMDPLGSH